LRRGLELGVLVVAVLLGYGIAGVFAGPGGIEPSLTPEPGVRSEPAPTSTTSMLETTSPEARAYLVWASGGLTPQLVDGLRSRFDDVSVVKGDVVELEAGDGWVVPLDGLALDPDDHRSFDPNRSLGSLAPGAVVLGESSAEFRGLGEGDDLSIAGSIFRIVGVVPDSVVGAAEVVFDMSDPDAPVHTDRYALVYSDLPRPEFEEAVRSFYEGPAPIRIRTDGETPWLRHGDAVLPQIFVKIALGEFSYRSFSSSGFIQDESFLSDHVVTADVPILGEVTCHEVIVDMLNGAMGQLIDEGLGHLVDPAGFAGCWNPRYITTIIGTLAGISRHAWGAAIDINAPTNPMGSAGDQDPRLVEIMQSWGFTWGGDWLVPDPMHFEYGVTPGR
jgi:hypothetical protein